MNWLRSIGLALVLCVAPALAADVTPTQQVKETYKTTPTSGQRTVTTSAVTLPSSAASGRRLLVVQNLGPSILYVGGSSVTTSNGIQLVVGGVAEFPLEASGSLYGITDSSSDVRILEYTN